MSDQIIEIADKFSKTENPFKESTLFVRDIAYGDVGSRDPLDILVQKMGTCSGKHFLLKEIYKNLGFEVKDMIAEHRFNNLNVALSEELQGMLDQSEVPDPHNFLKVKVGDEWYQVDVTWDKSLAKVGLETNEDWEGKSDMKLCVSPDLIIEVEDGLEYKKQFIAKLPEETQVHRADFIKRFGVYLAGVRGKITM